jgi:hypothetical protein
MHRTLTRLEQTAATAQRLADAGAPAGQPNELSTRARRLGDRIDIVRYKLRAAFRSDGREADGPALLQAQLQSLANVDRDDAPPDFLCPIAQTLMVDPVRTVDGNVYDRSALLEWFATFKQGTAPTSPLTNLPLPSIAMTPVGPLRRRIAHYIRTGEVPHDDTAREPQHHPGGGHRHHSAPTAAPPAPLGDDEELDALRRQSTPFDEVEEAARKRAAERALTRAPIWSSAVVPAGEENSRVLNMLRVHEAEEGAAPAGSGDVGPSPAKPRILGRAIGRTASTAPPASAPLLHSRAARRMMPPVPAPPAASTRRSDLYSFAAVPKSVPAPQPSSGYAPRRPLVSTRPGRVSN